MYCIEQLLESIHRAAPIVIGVVINRTIQTVNPHMCKMLGYSEEELVEQKARILYTTKQEYERVGREKYAMLKAKGIGKGTGLGLSMTYSIIENHRGKIEVESTAGEGTTFAIYLPTTTHDRPDASLAIVKGSR